jgi:hypothetical protein
MEVEHSPLAFVAAMPARSTKYRWSVPTWALPLLIAASPARPATSPGVPREVINLTGLPAYPSLDNAVMEDVARTDTLGRWCMRFWSQTSDPLEKVEAWYRKTLVRASETDLRNDKTYQIYTELAGVKFSMDIDSVAVYKVSKQAPTTIDLYRCSPMK